MKTKMNRSLIYSSVLAFSLVSTSASLVAQGLPLRGAAAVTVGKVPTALSISQPLSVDLLVDVSGVTGAGVGGLRTAAVLGGYQVEVSFDSSVVRFDGVSGGNANGFTSGPVFTNPAVANSIGRVRVVAAQTSMTEPVGLAKVATLQFTTVGAGFPAISVKPLSLATAFQGKGAGPAAIPTVGPRVRSAGR